MAKKPSDFPIFTELSEQGRNFEIAAETAKKEHLKAGDDVKIIFAKTEADNFRNASGTEQDAKNRLNSPIFDLVSQIEKAFGNGGIDKFAYFGHSDQYGLYAFDNTTQISQKRLDERHIKPNRVTFNEGAQIFLMGCNAGTGDNPVAQKDKIYYFGINGQSFRQFNKQ